MADSKITALTSLASPLVTDIVPIVSDPAGTPVTKKTTLQAIADLFAGMTQTLIGKTLTSPLFQGIVDGWISANESWAYASATTITVPSGAASKYQIGDVIKLTQTTVKYFTIIGVADTVLTVFGGTDYTVANAAITLNYYSHNSNPLGFPAAFNYIPTVTAPGGTPPTFTGSSVGRLTTRGRKAKLVFQLENSSGGTAGSGSVNAVFSLPFTALNYNNFLLGIGLWYNGGAQAFLAPKIISATTFALSKVATTYLQAVDLNNAARFVYGELEFEF